jgi:membrane protease YdiL (CAAX protease family)
MESNGTRRPQSTPRFIAPLWHTATVIVFLLAISLLSVHTHGQIPINPPRFNARLLTYYASIVLEWLMVAWIGVGVWLRGGKLRTLIGGRWTGWRTVLRDVGVAIAFLIVANFVLQIVGRMVPGSSNNNVRNLLPHTPLETLVFLTLALSAGFCEEIVFRGYLQQQLTGLTRSLLAGLVIQAAIFGLSHGYQGAKLMSVIAIYGLLFGLLSHWRKSLRPGIIAHGLQDSLAVFLR